MRKNVSKEEENLQFVTSDKINVTSRITKGITARFTCRKEAENHARQIGSYVYDLYCYATKASQDSPIKFYGYAVPR